jgi:Phage-related minor tail protein
MDSVAQIILRAKDEASKVIGQVDKAMASAQSRSTQSARAMGATLSLGANTARAALIGLSGAAGFVGAALLSLDGQMNVASSGLAAFTGMGMKGIPEIKKQMQDLFGKNDASVATIEAALKQVYTAFKIFKVDDPEGLAQILIDWNDVTGQNLDEAGAEFRRLVLLYFGPDADANAAMDDITDKILAVAQAVGIDPGGLAAAMADAGPVLKTAFGSFDDALSFLAAIGAAGGDIDSAEKAVMNFISAVEKVRDARGKGPDEQPKDVIAAMAELGLNVETVVNEAQNIGDLMMLALKQAMEDQKITPEELTALGVLFGNKIGPDMAMASGSVAGFVKKAKEVLEGDYKNALENAAKVTDENVTARMTQAWNSLLTTLSQTKSFEGIQGVAEGALRSLEGLVKLDWKSLGGGLATIGDGLFKTLLGADPKDVADALVWWWDDVAKPGIKGFFDQPMSGLMNGLSSTGSWFDGLFKFMVKGNDGGSPSAIAATVKSWWENDVVKPFNAFLANPIDTLFPGLHSLGNDVFKLIFSYGKAQADLKNWWDTSIWPSLRDFPARAWDWAKAGLKSIGDDISRLLFGVDSATLGAIMSLMWANMSRELGKAWEATKSTVSGVGASIWDAIKGGTSAAILGAEGALAWGKNQLGKVMDGLAQWLEPITVWAGGIWDSIKTGVGDAINDSSTGIAKWALNRWADLQKGFDVWLKNAVTLGADILKGIIKGISGAWDDLVKAVEKIGGGVLDQFKKIFNIKSPSREMELIGSLIMQGLMEGFEKSKSGPIDSIGAIAKTLTGQVLKMYDDLQAIHEGRSGASWTAFTSSSIAALDTVGIKTTDSTKAMLLTWAGYADAFRGYMEKFNGDILKALGHTLVDIIEGEIIKVLVAAAAQVAIAAVTAPLTFGASLLANAPILAASALGVAGLEALKASIPAYAVGTPYVPNDQLAMVHQGEMIIPKTFAEGVRRGDVALGDGSGQTIVQVILDGRMITEQIGSRMFDGVRGLVRADLRGSVG